MIWPSAGVLRGRASPAPSTVELALLDTAGVIVAVNDAWLAFAAENGGETDRTGVGMSYLRICEEADDQASCEVAAAIRSAVSGDLPAPMVLSVPCDAPGTPRTFDVLVSSRFGDDGRCVGATVTFSRADPTSRADPIPERADHGLKRRLIEIVDDHRGPTAVRLSVDFAGPLDSRLTADLEDTVLRVVEATLDQVMRVRGASTVHVSVAVSGPHVVVQIVYGGSGVDDTAGRTEPDWMRRSAESRGGTLEIDSTADGTAIRWTAKLRPVGRVR